MRLQVQVDGKWVNVETDKQPTDSEVDEIVSNLKKTRAPKPVSMKGDLNPVPINAPNLQKQSVAKPSKPSADPMFGRLPMPMVAPKATKATRQIRGSLPDTSQSRSFVQRKGGGRVDLSAPSKEDIHIPTSKYGPEVFGPDAIQSIVEGNGMARLSNGVMVPTSEAVQRYHQLFGKPVPGLPNSESATRAYTNNYQLPAAESQRLGNGQNSSKFFKGAQKALGGLALGIGGAGSTSLNQAARIATAKKIPLQERIGTWIANAGPQFALGLGANDPWEMAGNIGLSVAGEVAHSIIGALSKIPSGEEMLRATEQAKKLGYPDLYHYVRDAPEMENLRVKTQAELQQNWSKIHSEASEAGNPYAGKLGKKVKPLVPEPGQEIKPFAKLDETKIGPDIQRAKAIARQIGVNPDLVEGFDSTGKRLKLKAKAGSRPAETSHASPLNPSQVPANPTVSPSVQVPSETAHPIGLANPAQSPIGVQNSVGNGLVPTETPQIAPGTSSPQIHPSPIPDIPTGSLHNSTTGQVASELHGNDKPVAPSAPLPGSPDTSLPNSQPHSTIEPTDQKLSSTKNAVTAQDRANFGLSELPKPEAQTFEGWLKQAREQGLNTPEKAKSLADRIIHGDEHAHLNEVENAGVADRMAHLKTEHQAITDEMAAKIEGGAKPEELADLKTKQSGLEDEFNHLSKATNKGGTPLGRMLAARKLTLNNDFQLVSVLNRAIKDKTSALTSGEREEFESMVKDLNQKVEDQKAHIDKLEAKPKRLRSPIERAGVKIPELRHLERVSSEDPRLDKFSDEYDPRLAKAAYLHNVGPLELDKEGDLTDAAHTKLKNALDKHQAENPPKDLTQGIYPHLQQIREIIKDPGEKFYSVRRVNGKLVVHRMSTSKFVSLGGLPEDVKKLIVSGIADMPDSDRSYISESDARAMKAGEKPRVRTAHEIMGREQSSFEDGVHKRTVVLAKSLNQLVSDANNALKENGGHLAQGEDAEGLRKAIHYYVPEENPTGEKNLFGRTKTSPIRNANPLDNSNRRTRSDIQTQKKEAIEDLAKAWNKANSGIGGGRTRGAVNLPFLDPEVAKQVGKLAHAYIQEGVLTLEDLHAKVKDAVKGIPDLAERITPQEIARAYDLYRGSEIKQRVLSDKGKFMQVLRLHGQIERALAGEVPNASVPRATDEDLKALRGKLSDVVKARQKGDPELDKYISALARAQKSLEDLHAGNKKAVKTEPVLSPEAQAAKAKAEEAQSELGQARRFKGVQDKLAGKVKPKVVPKGPVGTNAEAIAEKVKAASDQLRDARKKSNLDKKLRAMQEHLKMSDEDFTNEVNRQEAELDAKKAKSNRFKDKEFLQRETDIKRLKAKINQRSERLRPKSAFERAGNAALAAQRLGLVQRVSTAGKVGATSVLNFATNPAESAVGSIIGKVSPTLAKLTPDARASVLAGYNGVKDFAKAFKDKDWLTKLKTGLNSLDQEALARGEDVPHSDAPPTLWTLIYRMHGAMTTPSQRAAFASESTKIAQQMARQGLNPATEENAAKIFSKAYVSSLRAIGLNKNFSSELIGSIGRAIKGNKPNVGRNLAHMSYQSEVPFTRVPTNAIGKRLEQVFGIPYGVTSLIYHTVNNSLDEEAAGRITRALKAGTVGTGLLEAGYQLQKAGKIKFGGYYNPGSKDDLKPGEVEINGKKIPKEFTYAKWMAPLQIGATIAQFEGKDDVGKGALNIARGELESAPLVGSASELGKASEDENAMGKYLGAYAKGFVEPGLMQEGAAYLDKDKNGNPVSRKVSGFRDEFRAGIPKNPLGQGREGLPVAGAGRRREGRTDSRPKRVRSHT